MQECDNWDHHWLDLEKASHYNPAQAFRREILVYLLEQQRPNNQTKLLDIGSGQGDLIAILTRIFPNVELAGLEMSAIGIEQSRAKAPNAFFYQRDLTLVPPPEDPLLEWATLAVCSEVLEHVDEPEKVLANATRYLAPGASLFITVPGGPLSAFDRHIGHRRHFDETSLNQLVRAAGLIPQRVFGVGFPFFNLYRMTVILRGKALIQDVAGEEDQKLGWLAKTAMRTFSLVLKRRLNSASYGWQMIAEARKPL